MCHLSRKVQDSYCSVQNVQDKRETCTKVLQAEILYLASRKRALYKIEGPVLEQRFCYVEF